MTDLSSLKTLIETYRQHGWELRRVVLSDEAGIPAVAEKVGVPVVSSVVNGAWFARPAGPDGAAWELRYLGSTQYALVERIDETAPGLEGQLQAVEQKMAAAIAEKGAA